MKRKSNDYLSINSVVLIGCIAFILSLPAQAVVVFTESFDGVSYTSSGNGSHVLGGAAPSVEANQWFGSTNGVSIASGDLTLGNTVTNRYRGAGVWLDADEWAAGTVSVIIEVANFVEGVNSEAIFQAYSANGVDATNSVSLDLHGPASLGGDPMSTGSATIDLLGNQQAITSNGSDVTFTFEYNGLDEFVGLVFANVNGVIDGTGNTADIDNITVSIVPEPSSMALLSLGGLALILRRKRCRR